MWCAWGGGMWRVESTVAHPISLHSYLHDTHVRTHTPRWPGRLIGSASNVTSMRACCCWPPPLPPPSGSCTSARECVWRWASHCIGGAAEETEEPEARRMKRPVHVGRGGCACACSGAGRRSGCCCGGKAGGGAAVKGAAMAVCGQMYGCLSGDLVDVRSAHRTYAAGAVKGGATRRRRRSLADRRRRLRPVQEEEQEAAGRRGSRRAGTGSPSACVCGECVGGGGGI